MSILDLDLKAETFWPLVRRLSAAMGNEDVAIGQLVKFMSIAQQRYKNNRFVSNLDFQNEVLDARLIGIAAIEVDKVYRYLHDENEFGWIKNRIENASKGGKAKAAARRNDSDKLGATKTYQKLPNATPLPLPSSLNTNTESTNVDSNDKQKFKITSSEDLGNVLTDKTKANFKELYPNDDFRRRESIKILNWLERNQKKNNKTVKGWCQFVANWLERAHADQVAAIPITPNSKQPASPEDHVYIFDTQEQVDMAIALGRKARLRD